MDASSSIDKKITSLKDWRGKTAADLRKIILSADKDLKEDFKWNSPMFTKTAI